MRKRVPLVVGGGIALLIASQFFNFGLGFRDGSGPGNSNDTQGQVSIVPNSSSRPKSITPDVTPEEAAMREAIAEIQTPVPTLPTVVDIMIDGNQYLVITRADNDEREVMTLDQIVALAATVEGEASGIRVRVARTPNAVAAAEAAVMKRLADAGLALDEIDARRQLVE